MKRKAIQLAHQTIVISLPAKWIKQQRIKKGDEIDVEEREGKLIIGSKEKNKEEEKIEIDISNLNDRVLRWILSALHKEGYDEIIMKYNKPLFTKTIEEISKDLFTGFVIVEQNENKCIFKAVSKDLESEFNLVLRKAFLVTILIGKNCLDIIKKEKLTNLKELIALEHTNNQLTNFCERILNKKGYSNYKKTNFMYTVVWNLEKICDEYKYICEYLSQPENNKTKISKEIINLFEKVNNFFEAYYELFYKFDINKLNKLSEERKEIEKEIKRFYKTKTDKEIIILTHLLNIVIKSVDFSASMFIINL